MENAVTTNLSMFDELSQFGDGVLAYIKPISGVDAQALIGQTGQIPANMELFCLFSADGTPLAISDSRSMALENALEHDLQPVHLH